MLGTILPPSVHLIIALPVGPSCIPLCCAAQDSVNALLQLYLVHLIDSGQHALLPLYACHLRADVRREVRRPQSI